MNITCIPPGDDAAALAFIDGLAARARPDGQTDAAGIEETVAAIVRDVKARGLEAVLEYSRRFDAPDFQAHSFAVPEAELAAAAKRLDPEDTAVILAAAENIRAFHQAQKAESWFRTMPDGGILGQMVRPVDRAGLYVPGGRGGETPLISSLLMNAVPALVAGVPELAVISPPRASGTICDHILAAAHLLGIREVYAAGSAWAIAALAFGAGPLRPVDVIAGPGNIFVATAKRLLIGTVGIDMIAGPSEICIVADSAANPAWIAADLLSQAEHDALASAVCLVTDAALAGQIRAELARQLELLPRKEIAAASLASFGGLICVPDLARAMELANRMAPEHLELMLVDPWQALPLVRHAGAVFMGGYSAEALGDYYAGPNHVLPTMGTARFSSALSVDTFCKRSSIIAASREFAAQSAGAVARLARLEGLEAHARSALCRSNGKE